VIKTSILCLSHPNPKGPLTATPSPYSSFGIDNLLGVQVNFVTLSTLFFTQTQHRPGDPYRAIFHVGRRNHGILAYLSNSEQPSCDPVMLRVFHKPIVTRSCYEFLSLGPINPVSHKPRAGVRLFPSFAHKTTIFSFPDY
jgi:hypothetical protein